MSFIRDFFEFLAHPVDVFARTLPFGLVVAAAQLSSAQWVNGNICRRTPFPLVVCQSPFLPSALHFFRLPLHSPPCLWLPPFNFNLLGYGTFTRSRKSNFHHHSIHSRVSCSSVPVVRPGFNSEKLGFFSRNWTEEEAADQVSELTDHVTRILDSFSQNYDKRVRPNYGGKCVNNLQCAPKRCVAFFGGKFVVIVVVTVFHLWEFFWCLLLSQVKLWTLELQCLS